MADNKNSAPDVEFNDDGQPNPDYKAPAPAGEGEGAGTEKKGTEGEDKKEGEGEEDFNDIINPAQPPEIPIRQSTAQHIIARKNEKIAKLQSKLKEGDEGYVAPKAGEEDEDENPDLTPEAGAAIQSEVQKALAPILGKFASDADEKDMQNLLSTEPESKKYLNHIKAYMSHDAYKGVPPSVIFHHLAFSAAQALGAKKKKAADLEAAQGKGGGRTIVDHANVSDLPSAEDITKMSDADFEKMENDARQGKFLGKK